MRKIQLTRKQLKPALRKLDRLMEHEAKLAMRGTAQFGLTAVQRSISRTKPRPMATGQYQQAWAANPTRDGAVVGNSAVQSIWVEAGRKRGKRPPLEPILEWIRVKKIFRTKSGKLKKTHRKPGSSRKRGAAAKRRDQLERGLAFAIQRKIGRKGSPARWPLRRAMPTIGKRAGKELKRAVGRAIMGV